jgi:hypothetical protein
VLKHGVNWVDATHSRIELDGYVDLIHMEPSQHLIRWGGSALPPRLQQAIEVLLCFDTQCVIQAGLVQRLQIDRIRRWSDMPLYLRAVRRCQALLRWLLPAPGRCRESWYTHLLGLVPSPNPKYFERLRNMLSAYGVADQTSFFLCMDLDSITNPRLSEHLMFTIALPLPNKVEVSYTYQNKDLPERQEDE